MKKRKFIANIWVTHFSLEDAKLGDKSMITDAITELEAAKQLTKAAYDKWGRNYHVQVTDLQEILRYK